MWGCEEREEPRVPSTFWSGQFGRMELPFTDRKTEGVTVFSSSLWHTVGLRCLSATQTMLCWQVACDWSTGESRELEVQYSWALLTQREFRPPRDFLRATKRCKDWAISIYNWRRKGRSSGDKTLGRKVVKKIAVTFGKSTGEACLICKLSWSVSQDQIIYV